MDVELRTGDIRDAQSVIAAANGCDAVIHSAAVYNMFATTRAEIVNPVLVGIENVCQAMAKNNISRLVYTSSIAAVGFAHSPTELRTPEDWHQDPQNLYFAAKHESEKRAVALAKQYGIEMVHLPFCCTWAVRLSRYPINWLDFWIAQQLQKLGHDQVQNGQA